MEEKEQDEKDSDDIKIDAAALERCGPFIEYIHNNWYYFLVIAVLFCALILMLHYSDVELARCNSHYQGIIKNMTHPKNLYSPLLP